MKIKRAFDMKTRLSGAFLAMWAMLCPAAGAQQADTAKKTLVAYFSWSGNTRNLACQIRELTGGDLFEIQTVKAYPEEYRRCTQYAKKEKEADARPALKGKVEGMDAYEVVFVGFPNWWGTAPMAVWSFLESYDLSGKTVIPFCTHGGGGEQDCFSDFAKHVGKADLKKGFVCPGGKVADARPKVEGWLKETGMK